jgi:hypothetical protein
MALGSTQPLTEMSTRYIPGGKGGRCVRLTTLPPSCAVVVKSGYFNFLERCGSLQACNGTAFYPMFVPLRQYTTSKQAFVTTAPTSLKEGRPLACEGKQMKCIGRCNVTKAWGWNTCYIQSLLTLEDETLTLISGLFTPE